MLLRRPLSSTLSPYTTLFRSLRVLKHALPPALRALNERRDPALSPVCVHDGDLSGLGDAGLLRGLHHGLRSEEHTSELQSRRDLVCRLLLEKKKHCVRESGPS